MPQVYVMYRRWRDFEQCRIGVVRTGGISTRSIQEGAEKSWILWTTIYQEEANDLEEYLAYEHGIPQTLFTAKKSDVTRKWLRRGSNWDRGLLLVGDKSPDWQSKTGSADVTIQRSERKIALARVMEDLNARIR